MMGRTSRKCVGREQGSDFLTPEVNVWGIVKGKSLEWRLFSGGCGQANAIELCDSLKHASYFSPLSWCILSTLLKTKHV